jgi:flagellar basal body-associated protein FliL
MLLVILAAFLVVAALAGAGIYLYMGMRETNPAFQQVSESVQQSLDSAANDLSGVQDIDVSADFADVDKDLNQL